MSDPAATQVSSTAYLAICLHGDQLSMSHHPPQEPVLSKPMDYIIDYSIGYDFII